MRSSVLKIILLLAITIACEDDPILTCESNSSLIIAGIAKCGTAEVTGYTLDLDANREAIGINLSEGNSTVTLLSLVLAPNPSNLFEEGKSYDFKNGEGSSFSGSKLGAVNSASITVVKLDRENELLTIQFNVDAQILPSNDPWQISGTISDLSIVP